MSDSDYTAQQRAGLAVWHLIDGKAMQTRDVAKLTGLSMDGALALMCNLSGVLPICQDDRGVWAVCSTLELEYTGIEI